MKPSSALARIFLFRSRDMQCPLEPRAGMPRSSTVLVQDNWVHHRETLPRLTRQGSPMVFVKRLQAYLAVQAINSFADR
jgi:hypothetical protein